MSVPQDAPVEGSPPVEELTSAISALAFNLRWSWQPVVQELFRTLAPRAWLSTRNPAAVLRVVAAEGIHETLIPHARAILQAKADLDAYLEHAPEAYRYAPRVAYCCMEFAIAECLPIYSGGLGVLAGDHLKASSDLGIPLVGVGLFYRYGYFQQVIDESGYQRERYDRLDLEDLPIRPVELAPGMPVVVGVPFPDRTVYARTWLAQVGRIPLYLLDTDIPENREDDRWITGHLYGGDQDTRIRQEIVLGVGGARLIRTLARLGLEPAADIVHMNEGHAAFLTLELARERLEAGLAESFHEASIQVAPRLAFTTHTPVAAGHDAFPSDLVEAYFQGYRGQIGLTHPQFMALGRHADASSDRFSMTVLALRSADHRNAVSQLHGEVSREMWGDIGLGMMGAKPSVEMDAVTNGIHTATWIGPEMGSLLDQHLDQAWHREPQRAEAWAKVARIRESDLWAARTTQRARLIERVDALSRGAGGAGVAAGITGENALVLGFARRFATYKRAGLLLRDRARLARLLGDPARPVLLVFAGKAHPRDDPGKVLMQSIVQAAREDAFRGRLIFLENYDVEIARLLVQGSDVWLNTPRRLEEASGTSGMKAVLNGALHLSELDGWWDEAYQAGLGWALGAGLPDLLPIEERDAAEAQQLIELMESQVVPLYFARNGADGPTEWLGRVKRSIEVLAPQFSAQRMVAEYVERVYSPAREAIAADRGALLARHLAEMDEAAVVVPSTAV